MIDSSAKAEGVGKIRGVCVLLEIGESSMICPCNYRACLNFGQGV